MIRKILLAIPAAAGAFLLAAPLAAHAAPVPAAAHATTRLTNRPDGGNGGTWAHDNVTRILTLKLTGTTGSGPGKLYHYDATVTDSGTFTVIRGALTPNQGCTGCAGQTIRTAIPEDQTTLSGKASYQFTATRPASTAPNAGVPGRESGAPATAAQTTSLWYEQAFPARTTFGGPGIGAWSWTYFGFTFTSRFPYFSPQQWVDAWNNGDGDLQGDGNITG